MKRDVTNVMDVPLEAEKTIQHEVSIYSQCIYWQVFKLEYRAKAEHVPPKNIKYLLLTSLVTL
jgi:hypothetical protein